MVISTISGTATIFHLIDNRIISAILVVQAVLPVDNDAA